MGIGGVVSLLWFQRSLPPYICKFFEMCLMVTADHGPAVSGAHNTIVCARAGKDLVSSLVSGLLTIVSIAISTFFSRKCGKVTYSVFARSPLSLPQTPFFRQYRSAICNPERSHWMGMP